MKKLTITLLASLTLAATSFAGHEVIATGKDSKGKELPLPTCFNDRELQFDVFGAYVDGNAETHAGPIKDHGWGGGIGVNYFFLRNVGIGVEGYWLDAEHNGAKPGQGGNSSDHTTFHNVNGSLIFRLPIDRICLAPYAYVGGGAAIDGDKYAVVFTGVGLEYRVVPNKVGVFVDARWNYFGDRYGQGDLNNFGTRAGVRLVF